MKQLIIARHAKSSWDNLLCPDFDRWLSQRGKRDLKVISFLLNESLPCPDCIVSSPAKRTKKTAVAYAEAWWYKKKHILWEHDIYEASLLTLVKVIEKIDEKSDCIVLVWHNPWLTDLVNYCGYTLENLPTCGVVVFRYDGAYRWSFEHKKCSYITHFFPKEVD